MKAFLAKYPGRCWVCGGELQGHEVVQLGKGLVHTLCATDPVSAVRRYWENYPADDSLLRLTLSRGEGANEFIDRVSHLNIADRASWAWFELMEEMQRSLSHAMPENERRPAYLHNREMLHQFRESLQEVSRECAREYYQRNKEEDVRCSS